MSKGYIKGVCLLLGLLFSFIFAADKVRASDKPVVMGFELQRHNGFLSEPGNYPIESLRRFGRAINKDWPVSNSVFKAASVFDASALGSPNFLKPVPFSLLSEQQRKFTDDLLSRHTNDLNKIINECFPASESIVIKIVCDSQGLKNVLGKIIQQPDAASKLKPQQIYRMENQLMPILEASDFLIGAGVFSQNGFHAKFNIVSKAGNLGNTKNEHNISIGNFINDNALMIFAQTHPIENAADAMKEIAAIPQSATIIQMVASAGLDFEKDILANTARESVLYVNLEPTGEGGLPDIRFAAPVPEIDKLRNNLDKLKTLCMQTGIFAQTTDDGKLPFVRLSYFMFPQVAVFAGLTDNFLVIATGKDNLLREMAHIQGVKSKEEKTPIHDLKRFWQIKFADFNLQLQKLLQSPLLRDKGIPPISNLKFLEDFTRLEITSKASQYLIEFNVNLPITKQ